MKNNERGIRTDDHGALRRFAITALLLAPLFFGPNIVLQIFSASLGNSPLVPAGNLTACFVTALAFLYRGRREPEARLGWLLLGLAALTVGLDSLHQLLALLVNARRPTYPSVGDWASLMALPVGGIAALCLPVRPATTGKSVRMGLDSLLFAAALLFIAFAMAYSRNARLVFALPAFRDTTLVQITLVIVDLAIVLYLVRSDPSILRGPLGIIVGALVATAIPALLAIRLMVSEVGYSNAHPIHLLYSAAIFDLCLAALCPWPLRRRRTAEQASTNLDVVLTGLAYLPFILTIFIGFLVISGNRALLWSGFTCFLLIMLRLILALVDYRALSRTLQERVREQTNQLKESQARLARTDRLDALGRLAGGVAHDFNNLLTTVVGNAQLLGDSLSGVDQRRSFVSEITRACDRASSLTRQLLTFARKQPRSLQVFSPADLVKDMQGLLRRTITESVQLTVRFGELTGNVKMDPHQLEQVVMNLALNARDAMPAGGSLFIEVDNESVNSEYASHHPNAKVGPHVRLRVRDSGTGIPKEVIDRIFDPFFTTKAQGRGTGLGLSICYGIVKEAEGHLTVDSVLGRGTTFDVHLPVTREVPDTPTPVPATIAPGGCKGTILLAEDEPSVRRLLVEVLRSAGYNMIVAENGSEAAKLASSHRGRIELFLTDLVMPEMGGLAAAEHVMACHPEAKVLVMSGYSADEGASGQLQSAEIPFLAKPVAPRALLARIREVIAI